MEIIRLLFLPTLTICLIWNENVAYAERTAKIPVIRVQIKPTGPTVEDYLKVHQQRLTELLETEQRPPPVSADHLKAFEQAVTSENALLEDICLGLKQELTKRSIIVVEDNPSVVLNVKIVRWGTDFSLPVPESDPPPGVVTVTCKKGDRDLFTTTFRQSSWGSTKKPHAIGMFLGKKTAKKLLELLEFR